MAGSTPTAPVGQVLSEMARRYQAALRAELARFRISEAAHPVLMLLHQQTGEWTVSRLADELALSKATISVTIGKMERAGLVTRSIGHDRRFKTVTLTPEARAMRAKLVAAQDAVERAMLAGLPPEQGSELRKLIARVNRLNTAGLPSPRQAEDGDPE